MHRATPGITPAKLTIEPLGTEGEMTPGPDDWNPFEEEEDRRGIEDLGFDPDEILGNTQKQRADALSQLAVRERR